MRRFCILALFMLLIGALTACDASTANIKSVTLTKTYSNGQAGAPTTTFAPTDTFHAVVDLANAPSDTKVTATWTALDAGNGQVKNQKIDSKDVTTGNTPIDFTLAPSQPFPVGKYQVEIFMNDKPVQTLPFEVQ